MDAILSLKESVVKYFSPPRKQASSKTLAPRLDRRSMSPHSRTSQWLQRPLAESAYPSPPSLSLRRVKQGRVKKAQDRKGRLSLSGATAIEHRTSLGRSLPTEPRTPVSDNAISRRLSGAQNKDAIESLSSQEDYVSDASDECSMEEDSDDSTLNGNENYQHAETSSETESDGPKEREEKNVQYSGAERDKRMQLVEQMSCDGMSPTEIDLRSDILLRGYKPLVPRHWSIDFDTLPDILMSSDDDKVPIRAMTKSDFHAIHALREIIYLPRRVRDRARAGRPEEELIKTEFERYLRWARDDGDYANKRTLPLLLFIVAPAKMKRLPSQSRIQYLEQLSRTELDELAERHRNLLAVKPSIECESPTSVESQEDFIRSPPTLFAIFIQDCRVVLVTYNAALPENERQLRSMAVLDMNKIAQDMWNAFAFALFVSALRNETKSLIKDGIFEPEEPKIEKDPDL
ncbi:MAG: hypothetical protein M1825_000185 [Sarcosagium campestre]|nr:MAG: hypothetical protein M1825_000185 [Sarcosagium campestre]